MQHRHTNGRRGGDAVSRKGIMKTGFVQISMKKYIELHLKNDPGSSREEMTAALTCALRDHKAGVRCNCGNPIWVIGSAVAGNACFTCITGEAMPNEDYEIDEANELWLSSQKRG